MSERHLDEERLALSREQVERRVGFLLAYAGTCLQDAEPLARGSERAAHSRDQAV